MTYIFDLKIPFMIECFFEREDNEHFVDVLADLADAVLFPGPHLGRNVVDDPESLGTGPFGDAHIKAWVVDEDKRIGLEGKDVFLTQIEVTKDGPQVRY